MLSCWLGLWLAAAPATGQPKPEVRQIVTFRFQPGKTEEATSVFIQSLLPIYHLRFAEAYPRLRLPLR